MKELKEIAREHIFEIILYSCICSAFAWIASRPMENKIKKPQEIVVVTESETEQQEEIPEVVPVQQDLVQQSTEESKEEESVPYTKEEHELLAAVLMAENGADWVSDRTVYLTGCVIMNRMNSEYYPNTLEEVIFQTGQYACTWNGGLYKYQTTDRCYMIAEELLMNGVPEEIPRNLVYQSEFVQGKIYEYVDGTYFGLKED